MLILGVVTSVYICILVPIFVWVCKKVQSRSWTIIALLVTMLIQALSSMLLYSYNYYIFTSDDDEAAAWSDFMIILIGEMPPLFYILAVIINLTNWTNYYFIVSVMASMAHPNLIQKS
jgi:hypothetical protein